MNLSAIDAVRLRADNIRPYGAVNKEENQWETAMETAPGVPGVRERWS